ncbi:MAG: 3-methyl-2-oxobutanoate hydroxymethyltransferase [Pseudomonadota bacterium]|nr:3-methyl-2-oxobutanoate hydroxymethyltransferase [Pseudomonadota bacterium]
MGAITLISTSDLIEMKRRGEKIACLTAYDASFARLADAAGVDILLVGDSLGMVVQGHDSTLGVRLNDMIYHAQLVRRGAPRSLVAVDMPFMSYATPYQALGNAGRLLGESGAQVVKLEGGAWLAATVGLLGARGIPVCGHLGLLPQSINKLGGYRVQGRDPEVAKMIKRDAQALESAGVAMLVLECVPSPLAAEISASATIPVIGIGAGPGCDGQVLVVYDMLGISERLPRFAKNFLAVRAGIEEAFRDYARAVKRGEFPGTEHGFE